MAGDRPTRRRLLRSVAGVGLGLGAGGCLGTGVESNRESTESGADRPTTGTDRRTATTEQGATGNPSRATPTETGENATEGDAPTTESGPTAGRGRGAHTVGMYTDLYFDPIGLFVEPGTTVSFELVSGAHSASAYHPENEYVLDRRIPRGAPSWTTDTLTEAGTFENVTFETRGTHDYYCIPHKQLGMVGRIVVGEPGGPATESPNPDGELPDSARIVEERTISYEEFQDDSG